MAKKLKIKLLPNGEIQMETIGVKGKKCLDYAKMLEMLTDSTIQKQELTAEYYETEEVEINQNEQKMYNQEY